jgi:hypothetical protein
MAHADLPFEEIVESVAREMKYAENVGLRVKGSYVIGS